MIPAGDQTALTRAMDRLLGDADYAEPRRRFFYMGTQLPITVNLKRIFRIFVFQRRKCAKLHLVILVGVHAPCIGKNNFMTVVTTMGTKTKAVVSVVGEAKIILIFSLILCHHHDTISFRLKVIRQIYEHTFRSSLSEGPDIEGYFFSFIFFIHRLA